MTVAGKQEEHLVIAVETTIGFLNVVRQSDIVSEAEKALCEKFSLASTDFIRRPDMAASEKMLMRASNKDVHGKRRQKRCVCIQ